MKSLTMMTADKLPTEILDRTFRYLSLESMKAVVLVCRRWREVGESLWSLRFSHQCVSLTEDNIQCLSVPRLRNLSSVSLSSVSASVLHTVLKHPNLKEVTIDNRCDISMVDGDLFGNVVSKMENVSISKSYKRIGGLRIKSLMNYSQMKLFFNRVNSGSILKSLYMDFTSLASVNPEILAQVVGKLETVSLRGTELTKPQIHEIFQVLSQDNKLKHFSISCNDLSELPPDILAKSFSNMSSLNISFTHLTAPQAESLFLVLSGSNNLQELKVGHNDLSSVAPSTLAKVVSRLRLAEMKDVNLTGEQWTHLFEFIGGDESKLESLNVSNNNLSPVDPSIISLALSKLVKVVLAGGNKLNTSQCKSIITSVCRKGAKTTDLTLTFKDLSQVNPSCFTIARCKLEKLNLGFTELKIEQVETILRELERTDSKLTELKLSGINLRSLESKFLVTVAKKLTVVDFNYARLTYPQLDRLFSAMDQGTTLKDLTISSNNLSTVPHTTLAKAVSNLERVNLSDTKLSNRQASTILETKGSKLKFIDLSKNYFGSFAVSKDIRKRIDVLL